MEWLLCGNDSMVTRGALRAGRRGFSDDAQLPQPRSALARVRQVCQGSEEHHIIAWRHQRRSGFQKRQVPGSSFQAAADGENAHVTVSTGPLRDSAHNRHCRGNESASRMAHAPTCNQRTRTRGSPNIGTPTQAIHASAGDQEPDRRSRPANLARKSLI